MSKEEEEALLENALDAIQTETGEGKTREEAERDRQKLLAGELLAEGMGMGEEDALYEEGLTYGPDGRLAGNDRGSNKVLSIVEEREAEVLRRSGCNIVSEDEVEHSVVLPWRATRDRARTNAHGSSSSSKADAKGKGKGNISIRFTSTNFDVMELDADGLIIDKGDEDFFPTPTWLERRPGFEFKLGERGLGYYRTGNKIQVPSNTAY